MEAEFESDKNIWSHTVHYTQRLFHRERASCETKLIVSDREMEECRVMRGRMRASKRETERERASNILTETSLAVQSKETQRGDWKLVKGQESSLSDRETPQMSSKGIRGLRAEGNQKMCSLLGQQSGKSPLPRGSGLPGLRIEREKERENERRAQQCREPEGKAHKPEIQSLEASHYSYHLYWKKKRSALTVHKKWNQWQYVRERMTDWGKDRQREWQKVINTE